MCGINGIISFKAPVDEHRIKKMNSCLEHRGPDGEGVWVSPDKKVVLGHRRLSIIDLSEKGSQPMHDSSKKLWIVFNGEIYNYVELKEGLKKDKVKFASDSDTEVILYLYQKYGPKCVEKLRGMFAFCIIDLKNNKAFLARDRMGKKPIIFCQKDDEFIFSSEIKPVVDVFGLEKEIDLDGLNHFLSHVYFHVPAPYTIFKNVKKLEPASYIEINLKTKKTKIEKYWRPDLSDENNAEFEKEKEEYLKNIKESVNIRERSDVPVGVLLSGGLDSSTILALMEHKNVHTFAIGYDKNDPELERARIVSKKFKTKHHEYTFEETGLSYLKSLIEYAGEPFNVPSALYAMQLSEKIKNEKIKVVMNGAGADEYFCGYSHHNTLWLLTKIMRLKKVIGRWPFKIFDVKTPSTKLTEFIRLMSIPDDKTKGEFYRIANQKLAPKLYSEKFINGIKQKDVGLLIDKTFNETKTSDTFKKHFYCDIALANAHSMTYTSDITGMANSIEIRSPFLDHELFLFGGNVPTKFKLRSYFSRKYNKYIMKKAAESFLPEEIVYAKKMGFGYNIKLHQLMRSELKNEVEIRLFRGNLEKTKLFNMNFIRECFDEHSNGKKNYGELLLGLLCIDEWFEQFMKN